MLGTDSRQAHIRGAGVMWKDGNELGWQRGRER